ncbi:hypothetical protein Esti_006484 [Eimeria stiedai]
MGSEPTSPMGNVECRVVRGVGENCYRELAAPLCTLQFTEYEASQSCPHSLALFFSLLRTCQQPSLLSATHSTCTSFNRTTNTILDPEAFCQSSHLRTDKDSRRHATFLRILVSAMQQESFNACQLIAVKVLVVRDPTFRSICRNIVVPYLVESTRTPDAVR